MKKCSEYQGEHLKKLKQIKISNFLAPSAVLIAQRVVGPTKQLKQTIQTEHNIVMVNQLAIYKLGRGFQLGATKKQIQVVVRAGLEPRTA